MAYCAPRLERNPRPRDEGLLHRFFSSSSSNHHFSETSLSLQSLAALWNDIVREIRLSYEKGTLLKRTERGAPNLKYNLLHQKFQMINYCIQRKLEVEGPPTREDADFSDPEQQSLSSDNEEDIFYDSVDSPDGEGSPFSSFFLFSQNLQI